MSRPPASSVWTYYNTTVVATTVVNQLITVCPTATTYTFNGCVYPVTQGQTLTVTNCPCTITTVCCLTNSAHPHRFNKGGRRLTILSLSRHSEQADIDFVALPSRCTYKR